MEIDTATGSCLDKIGAFQGVDRNGLSDDDYRNSILSEMSKREREARKTFWQLEH